MASPPLQGRRRTPGKSTTEDQALNVIASEAEARLAAKRAARAEARIIRMKELERMQQEADEKMDRDYQRSLITDDPLKQRTSRVTEKLQSRAPPANDIEMNGPASQDTQMRTLQDNLREVNEKYKKAMVSNAQLDNEKQALAYQVDCLKDRLEEAEEVIENLKQEILDKTRDLNRVSRENKNHIEELEKAREQLILRDKLLEEHGIPTDGSEQPDISQGELANRLNDSVNLELTDIEVSATTKSRESSRRSSAAPDDRDSLLEQIKVLKEQVSDLRRNPEFDNDRLKDVESLQTSDDRTDLSLSTAAPELEKSEAFEDVTEEAIEIHDRMRSGMVVNNNERNEDFDVIEQNLRQGELSNFEDRSYEPSVGLSESINDSLTDSVLESFKSNVTNDSMESEKPFEISAPVDAAPSLNVNIVNNMSTSGTDKPQMVIKEQQEKELTDYDIVESAAPSVHLSEYSSSPQEDVDEGWSRVKTPPVVEESSFDNPTAVKLAEESSVSHLKSSRDVAIAKDMIDVTAESQVLFVPDKTAVNQIMAEEEAAGSDIVDIELPSKEPEADEKKNGQEGVLETSNVLFDENTLAVTEAGKGEDVILIEDGKSDIVDISLQRRDSEVKNQSVVDRMNNAEGTDYDGFDNIDTDDIFVDARSELSDGSSSSESKVNQTEDSSEKGDETLPEVQKCEDISAVGYQNVRDMDRVDLGASRLEQEESGIAIEQKEKYSTSEEGEATEGGMSSEGGENLERDDTSRGGKSPEGEDVGLETENKGRRRNSEKKEEDRIYGKGEQDLLFKAMGEKNVESKVLSEECNEKKETILDVRHDGSRLMQKPGDDPSESRDNEIVMDEVQMNEPSTENAELECKEENTDLQNEGFTEKGTVDEMFDREMTDVKIAEYGAVIVDVKTNEEISGVTGDKKGSCNITENEQPVNKVSDPEDFGDIELQTPEDQKYKAEGETDLNMEGGLKEEGNILLFDETVDVKETVEKDQVSLEEETFNVVNNTDGILLNEEAVNVDNSLGKDPVSLEEDIVHVGRTIEKDQSSLDEHIIPVEETTEKEENETSKKDNFSSKELDVADPEIGISDDASKVRNEIDTNQLHEKEKIVDPGLLVNSNGANQGTNEKVAVDIENFVSSEVSPSSDHKVDNDSDIVVIDAAANIGTATRELTGEENVDESENSNLAETSTVEIVDHCLPRITNETTSEDEVSLEQSNGSTSGNAEGEITAAEKGTIPIEIPDKDYPVNERNQCPESLKEDTPESLVTETDTAQPSEDMGNDQLLSAFQTRKRLGSLSPGSVRKNISPEPVPKERKKNKKNKKGIVKMLVQEVVSTSFDSEGSGSDAWDQSLTSEGPKDKIEEASPVGAISASHTPDESLHDAREDTSFPIGDAPDQGDKKDDETGNDIAYQEASSASETSDAEAAAKNKSKDKSKSKKDSKKDGCKSQ